MKRSLLLLLVMFSSLGVVLGQHSIASQSKNDEQIIRDLIQSENEDRSVIKYTEDAIFVSGLYPRPIIGRKQMEASRIPREEMSKRRPNEKRKMEVVRLVVSQSGDVAYEFGNFTTTYDAPDKTRTGFEGSYLRAWRKVGGEWLVDARFFRPNESAEKPKSEK